MVLASQADTAVGRSARIWRWRPGARRYPWIPIFVVLTLVLCALFANLLSPHDPRGKDEPIRIRTQKTLQPPFQTWDNPLGTDRTGRDVLSRMIHGARTSAVISVIALGSGVLIGTVLGLIAGYRGGWLGAVIMRLVDTVLAFPVNSGSPAHHSGA